MERSPRSAAVPRTRASMGQYHTLRSFVVTLAITIVITKSPVSGFTIPRQQSILDSLPDLETGESTQLEVRYDLKISNNSDSSDDRKINNSDSRVIAINVLKNTEKNDTLHKNNKAVQVIVNKTADMQTKIPENNKSENRSDPLNTSSVEGASQSITTSAPSTSQTTTREPEISQVIISTATTQTSLATDSQISTSKESSNTTANDGKVQNENYTKSITYRNNSNSANINITHNNTSIEKQAATNINDTINKNNTIKKVYNNMINRGSNIFILNDTEFKSAAERKDPRSIFDLQNLDSKNESNYDDQEADQTHTKEQSSTSTTDTATETSTYYTDLNTDVTKVNNTTEATTNTDYSTAKTLNSDFYTLSLPPWKKYTTIDRKRISTEDTTISTKEMAVAETSQISLDKVLTSNTLIPSLEQLKNELLNSQESTTRKFETPSTIEAANINNVQKSETPTPNMIVTTEIGNTKLELVSKRAGYKDNRETTMTQQVEATTSELPTRVIKNNTEMFSSMYETEPSEVEGPDTKNDTVYESQSQLAEDAIKEELLKEEMLNDNEENAKRYVLPKVKGSKEDSEGFVTVPETDTEDMLSVKPIGHEKKKNTILYTVNPNYKPLKKIDVQPPKLFVRDPDDNSWRNESISSLGIVFKPKNASKSFTQVLKNKTEIELANMTDKDNKDNVPDLRVRLEKIAEVRKSKKKINKFGDTVYSDYEESGENVNVSLKEETTTPSFEDSILNFTPPPISKSLTTEFDLSVNAISTEGFNLFKNEMKPSLTTNKPKKFYNLAEYYDATDEYDADYVNQHKIDLKKFTKPLTPKENPVTPPTQVFRTQPMREYQPERKATLQYFPPTQKNTQKVNLNDYDVDFNRKVNLYTMKAPLKHSSPTSFGTASPLGTDKYLPVNKITMKPTYTPMYQTNSLDKNLYLTTQPRVPEPPSGFVPNDGNFNRASYVIKHYRDFINEAAKESEDERGEYPYTEPPLRGVTINELAKMTTPKEINPGDDDYEYDVKFRKDIMNRFVDNFNQNSERFRVDFPILYNSSIVHRQTPENGRIASSTAFIKRLYEVSGPRASNFLSHRKPCDPHCDPNLTVELSPAYELHYYVPEQEEKEEMEQKPATVPYPYRL
ncbi:unnamed protein product [Spodoptera littoralis]|uniref:Uncharacterized protein n=1 Tax=Spodoptera littoralis TaxID=7109 RepID=A0A9P0IHB8_SPOLI|nr:unnamed protein product [Spodoptera littoralis]CAH1645811.1 unnamed protein product [Spodoptera littoralis]